MNAHVDWTTLRLLHYWYWQPDYEDRAAVAEELGRRFKSAAWPTTTEIVYRWPDGREEVRYRRPYGSESAAKLIDESERAGDCYFVRHV